MNKFKYQKKLNKKICYICGKEGHKKINCPKTKKSKNLKNIIITKEDLIINNIKCLYCGSSNHLICNKKSNYYIEDYDSDNVSNTLYVFAVIPGLLLKHIEPFRIQ